MQPSSTDNIIFNAVQTQEQAPRKRAIIRWIDKLNEGLLLLLALVLGGLACLGIVQVLARYILQSPIAWSEEVIRFALIWLVFLGAGITVRKGMLVAVEAIYIIASPLVARVIGAISLLISAAFWLVLVIYGWSIIDMVEGLTSGSLELKMSVVYAAIPAGALLALINTAAVAIDPPRAVFTQAAS